MNGCDPYIWKCSCSEVSTISTLFVISFTEILLGSTRGVFSFGSLFEFGFQMIKV